MNFLFVLMLSLFFLVPGTETLLVGVATDRAVGREPGGVVVGRPAQPREGAGDGPNKAFLRRRCGVGFLHGAHDR